MPLSAITATAIAEFQRTRHEAGIANRTINMDVGVRSRVLKSCGRVIPLNASAIEAAARMFERASEANFHWCAGAGQPRGPVTGAAVGLLYYDPAR